MQGDMDDKKAYQVGVTLAETVFSNYKECGFSSLQEAMDKLAKAAMKLLEDDTRKTNINTIRGFLSRCD